MSLEPRFRWNVSLPHDPDRPWPSSWKFYPSPRTFTQVPFVPFMTNSMSAHVTVNIYFNNTNFILFSHLYISRWSQRQTCRFLHYHYPHGGPTWLPPPPGRWWAPCPPAWQAAGTAWSATTLPTGGFPSQCPSTSGPGRSLRLLPTRWSTRSSTSRGSSEGPRHLKVTVRSSTTSAGLFVKKKKETFEDSFQRYSNFFVIFFVKQTFHWQSGPFMEIGTL